MLLPLPRRPLPLLGLLVLGCAVPACGTDAPDDPFPAPAEGKGFQLAMEATVGAGEEIWACQVGRVPTPEYTAVNHVESIQNDFMHHMDVMLVPFHLDLAEGRYDCNDLYGANPDLMDGTTIYASQFPEQQITLPEGTIASIPGGIKILHELHYVNTQSEEVTAFSKVNVHRYEGEIQNEIWGGVNRDRNINVPPGDSIEWTRCVMTEDVDLLFLAAHTHQLARKTEVRRFDGTNVGELIYENTDWTSPKLQSFSDAPLRVAAGTGFEYQCHYRNNGTNTVHWGPSALDEMCQIAMVYTPGTASIECMTVETSDGVLPE